MNYTKEYFDFDLDRKNTRSMKWMTAIQNSA